MKNQKQINAKEINPSVEEMLRSAKDFHPLIQKLDVPPERVVKPGDEVVIGALKDIRVLDTLENGRWVLIEYKSLQRNSTDHGGLTQSIWPWNDVYKKVENAAEFNPDPLNEFMNHFSNTCLQSIINMYMFNRISFDVDYQRDYVWSEEDKNRLLDSIFEGKDIGKFIFVNKRFPEKMDILDGKQRLSTIIDFYLGKISYRGVKWHEVGVRSRDVFANQMIQKVELDGINLKKSDLLKIFLNVNTGGVPQSPEHIKSIQAMLEKTLEEEGARSKPKM